MKLELKHLAPYLPYGLKIQYNNWEESISIMKAIHYNVNPNRTIISFKPKKANYTNNCFISSIKPILRPLSDLTKIEVYGGLRFEPMNWFKEDDDGAEKIDLLKRFMNGKVSYCELGYEQIERLFSWHFDVFGLIKKGLAIDINTLNQ